jgi:hypothetical protein
MQTLWFHRIMLLANLLCRHSGDWQTEIRVPPKEIKHPLAGQQWQGCQMSGCYLGYFFAKLCPKSKPTCSAYAPLLT